MESALAGNSKAPGVRARGFFYVLGPTPYVLERGEVIGSDCTLGQLPVEQDLEASHGDQFLFGRPVAGGNVNVSEVTTGSQAPSLSRRVLRKLKSSRELM
jgi:hypothetical protein